jgi:iron(III) transport system ATP-binding protein
VLRQAGDPREVYLAPVDRETAEFLGQAIILDAVIADGFAVCALGRIPVRGAGEGSAQVMLRPEQIQLQPAKHRLNGTTVPIARVVAAEFGGPSGNITIAIPPGQSGRATETVIVHKSYGSDVPAIDSEVAVTVVGSAHVFGAQRPG